MAQDKNLKIEFSEQKVRQEINERLKNDIPDPIVRAAIAESLYQEVYKNRAEILKGKSIKDVVQEVLQKSLPTVKDEEPPPPPPRPRSGGK